MNESESSNSSFGIAAVGLVVLVLVVGVLFLGVGMKPLPSPPLPAGQVEVHVKFQGISTEDFNKLTTFVRALPTEHTNDPQSNYDSFHGFWKDGHINRRYHPNHPFPNPEIEKAMAARSSNYTAASKVRAFSGFPLSPRQHWQGHQSTAATMTATNSYFHCFRIRRSREHS